MYKTNITTYDSRDSRVVAEGIEEACDIGTSVPTSYNKKMSIIIRPVPPRWQG